MAGRGQLTQEIKEKSKELLGYEIDTVELRLMPYIQYVMVNHQSIDPNKINQEERQILSRWRSNGWIEGGAGGLGISKEFWNILHEVLWMGYVDYE